MHPPQGMEFIDPTSVFGAGITMVCFVASYFVARQVAGNSRLFTVMALFACAWVLVLTLYERPSQHFCTSDFQFTDRASDLASFLFVFAGVALSREGNGGHWLLNPEKLQLLAMWLLFLLVLPRQFPQFPAVSAWQVELAASAALGLVGFLALALGVRTIARPLHFWIIAFTLIVYSGLLLARTAELWAIAAPGERERMSAYYVLGFAATKLLLTSAFAYVVYRHHHFARATSGLQSGASIATS
jgi:hypothetical protein